MIRDVKKPLIGAVTIGIAIGAFWTLAGSVLAFPDRPAQSLGFDVGNLPPNGSPSAQPILLP